MAKWFIYTVLVGALPFIIRLLIYLFKPGLSSDYIINEVDMVTFGLVLHVSNINELEGRSDMSDESKLAHRGISTVAIVVFGAILGVAYVADIIKNNFFDLNSIKKCSAILGGLSLAFSYFIHHRQNSVQNG